VEERHPTIVRDDTARLDRSDICRFRPVTTASLPLPFGAAPSRRWGDLVTGARQTGPQALQE